MLSTVEIVIPVYNEGRILVESITNIFNDLEKTDLSYSVHLIENGSTDNTVQLINELMKQYENLRVTHLDSANYGIALKYGLENSSADYLVNFDIDFYDIEFVQLAAKILPIKYDIIIASKNLLLSKDQRTFFRKFASLGFRYLLFLIFGLRVSDTHGIKAWRNSEQLKEYFNESFPGKHSYDTEVIIRAMYDDCDILEVPISVIEKRDRARSLISRIPLTLVELYSIYKRVRK